MPGKLTARIGFNVDVDLRDAIYAEAARLNISVTELTRRAYAAIGIKG